MLTCFIQWNSLQPLKGNYTFNICDVHVGACILNIDMGGGDPPGNSGGLFLKGGVSAVLEFQLCKFIFLMSYNAHNFLNT